MNKEEPSQEMKIARELGKVPDWAWNQINGSNAQENYTENRKKIYERFLSKSDSTSIKITSEIKKK